MTKKRDLTAATVLIDESATTGRFSVVKGGKRRRITLDKALERLPSSVERVIIVSEFQYEGEGYRRIKKKLYDKGMQIIEIQVSRHDFDKIRTVGPADEFEKRKPVDMYPPDIDSPQVKITMKPQVISYEDEIERLGLNKTACGLLLDMFDMTGALAGWRRFPLSEIIEIVENNDETIKELSGQQKKKHIEGYLNWLTTNKIVEKHTIEPFKGWYYAWGYPKNRARPSISPSEKELLVEEELRMIAFSKMARRAFEQSQSRESEKTHIKKKRSRSNPK